VQETCPKAPNGLKAVENQDDTRLARGVCGPRERVRERVRVGYAGCGKRGRAQWLNTQGTAQRRSHTLTRSAHANRRTLIEHAHATAHGVRQPSPTQRHNVVE
jgi:hypothetical protein